MVATHPEKPVAKKADKPAQPGAPEKDKQVNFRASPRLSARLEYISEALGLDVSNLVRMVLNEKLDEYEARATAVVKARDKS